ncbi:hypothetical protein [Mycolicibacterium vaccae]|uniref:hypothetical protein n=1 Tax=Mycolicibacterium vaccae TaxID=1810 RepID=UPI003D05E1F6
MVMIVRGEERTCDFCGLGKDGKNVDAYVCVKFLTPDSDGDYDERGAWFDLCEEHFAKQDREISDDGVVLLVNDG